MHLLALHYDSIKIGIRLSIKFCHFSKTHLDSVETTDGGISDSPHPKFAAKQDFVKY